VKPRIELFHDEIMRHLRYTDLVLDGIFTGELLIDSFIGVKNRVPVGP
jgi:hypothetical protein